MPGDYGMRIHRKLPLPEDLIMKLRLVLLIFLLAATSSMTRITLAAENIYKIRIGFPSLAFSYMPYYVAQEKGIYKKYNVEAEYIQMSTTIQPQAVVAGN